MYRCNRTYFGLNIIFSYSLWQTRNIAAVVIYLNAFLTVATSYKCLQCDDVPLPNLCDKVGECGAHELCAVEQYTTSSGSFRYRQTCMDMQTCGAGESSAGNNAVTCKECCHGDLCNAGGCGKKGFDPALGPLCYACHIQIGPKNCYKIQQCGRDQVCSIHPVLRLGAPDNRYETKCTERHVCATINGIDSSMIVGRKRSTCNVCCNSSLCNDFDSRPCAAANSVSTVATSPTTKTTSVHSEQTSSMQTVTAKKTVTSNGFTKASVTPEVCEDAANAFCNEHICSRSPKEYIQINCRKTCQLCTKPTTRQAVTTEKTVTFNGLSTASATRGAITGHTHNPFCRDTAVGCDQFLRFCQLDAYKDWTKSNCRRTCNYC